jgi:hypothetical protein
MLFIGPPPSRLHGSAVAQEERMGVGDIPISERFIIERRVEATRARDR